jgi:hypothetical protein
MKKPETKLKEKVLADLKGLGAWAEKIQQVGKVGTPDILACINGKFIALELKSKEDELPSKAQVIKLRKIKKAGGFAAIVTPKNWPLIKKEIASLASLLS